MMTDLRYAVRALARTPATTLLVIATLALGIGANTAIFSVVDAVLLRPLPYPAGDRIVVVQEVRRGSVPGNSAPADFLDLQQRTRTLDRIAAVRGDVFDWRSSRGLAHLGGAHVTADFFDVFGLTPELGRGFVRGDEGLGKPPRVVLGHAAWVQHFGSDPAIVGKVVELGGVARIVTGVMPVGFDWPEHTAVWALAPAGVPPPPMAVTGDLRQERELAYFDAIGRLAPGVSLDQARGDSAAIAGDVARHFPASNAGVTFALRSLHDFTVGDVRLALTVLLASIGVVLLIACANIANVLIARTAAREREIAVRAALGASRGRLVRLFALESLVLAGIGGTVATGVAAWSLSALRALVAGTLPRADGITLDVRVAAFTAMATLATAVLCGLAPLLSIAAVPLADSLRSAPGRVAGGRPVLRRGLVVAEMALAVVLVAAAGLMLHSLWRLTAVDAGLRVEGVSAAQIALPEQRYPTLDRQADFYNRLADAIRHAPGIASAAVTFPVPLSGRGASASFDIAGREAPSPSSRPGALMSLVSPGYFATLAVPILRGRDVTERDDERSARVALVNRTFVARHLRGLEPLGQRIVLGPGQDEQYTIVGVVGDFRRESLAEPPAPTMFLPYRQLGLPFMEILVRTAAPGDAGGDAIRAALRTLDPDLEAGPVETLASVRDRAAAEPRLRTLLLALFGAMAVGLACLGVYGVLSQSVVRRRRELGIRIAVGAAPADVYRLVLGEALGMAGIGLALGLTAALVVARVVLPALLYETSPRDPATFASVVLLLGGVALLAAWAPARRAMRVDPIAALRAE